MARLAVVCALALACASAWADPPPPPAPVPDAEAEARRHFDAAQKAFADGDYDTAVAEFEAANRIKPHYDVEINIATCYERIYKPKQAREHYEAFLREAPPDSPLRALANYRLRVLRSLPGSILVDASKPGATVHLVGEGHDATARTPHQFEDLPPGRYRIHVELAYHTPHDVVVNLEPGGQDVVNVPLEHQVETLTIFTRPSGARVFLDDREEGVTPFSRPVDVGKNRRLRLEAEDFPPVAEEIDILPGHPVDRSVVFRRPTHSGRSELVLFGMLYGAGGSAMLAEAFGGPKLDSITRLSIDVAASIVGVGVGLLTTIFTTDDYVKLGHSSIIIGSTVWGAIAGASLSIGLGLSEQNTLAVTLLGSGLGLGTGIITARVNDTSPGDAAIVNSGGMWGSVAGLLLAEAIRFDPQNVNQALGWLTLAGTAVGVTAGAFLAWGIEISRGHVAVVDAFGLAGLALSFAVGYGVAPSDDLRLETGARYGLGGLAIGLLGGAILSRKYKDDLPPTEALLTVHNGRFAFAFPQLRANLIGPRDGQLLLQLAKGEF